MRFVRIYGEKVFGLSFAYLEVVVSQGQYKLLETVLSLTKECYYLHQGADRPVISF